MAMSMYKMKPIFTADQMIELPSCMYHLKNLHSSSSTAVNGSTIDHHERQSSPTEIAKLEAVQEDILMKLSNLKNKLEQLRKMVKEPFEKPVFAQSATFSSTCNEVANLPDVVVTANPSTPPHGLLALRSAWLPEIDVCISSHSHSSLKGKVPLTINKTFNTPLPTNNVASLRIRIIWGNVSQTELITSPARQVIKGDVNILRLLSRFGPSHLSIDSLSAEEAAVADSLLDLIHGCFGGSLTKNAFLNKLTPGPKGWLLAQGPSIVDVALWSYLKAEKSAKCPPKLSSWLKTCDKTFGQ